MQDIPPQRLQKCKDTQIIQISILKITCAKMVTFKLQFSKFSRTKMVTAGVKICFLSNGDT